MGGTAQVIEAPGAQDLRDLEARRAWVRGHYDAAVADRRYASLEGKLALLEAILSQGWVDAAETLKLQCLGVTFGDALAQRLGLDWVMVEDAYGRDPALRAGNTSVLTFPLTAISKRVERGEAVDVRVLFDAAVAAVEAAIAAAGDGPDRGRTS